MFENVYRIGETERIYVYQLRNIGIGRIHIHIGSIAENVLVFALCRLYHKERYLIEQQLRKHLIYRVALARTR